jgi:NAD(P)-dependent dehydrogenase (short-subunit alcohol dehydrogenase family)
MAELRFDGRVAVVTGAGRGIGRAEAMLLAERGASVVVNDLGGTMTGTGQASGPAEEVAAEIVAAGGTAIPSSDTIATPEGARAIVDLAVERFGRIDALVNNAGILDLGTFPEINAEDLQRQLSVHLLGYFNVTRAAWPHMADRGYGRVVMTTSSAGIYGIPKQVAYGAAKAGLIGLMRCLACLGTDVGIKVNSIAPGAYTRMVDTLSDEEFRSFSAATRSPSAVAPIVAVLAHDSCPVTGEIFTASSGRVARIFFGETKGFFGVDHRPDDLLENWKAIMDEDEFVVPTSAGDNLQIVLARLREAGVPVPDFALAELSRSDGANQPSASLA